MASAGQAHAHSSQPMHFSSPSGQRFSWWRPWNRGAVGRFSSGYWTVSTFLNIWWKVTPNPLTGLRKSGTGDLLAVAAWAGPGERLAPGTRGHPRVKQGMGGVRLAGRRYPDAVIMRQVKRGNREAGQPRRRLAGPGPGDRV